MYGKDEEGDVGGDQGQDYCGKCYYQVFVDFLGVVVGQCQQCWFYGDYGCYQVEYWCVV